MIIPLPIPIGCKRVAIARGSVWKLVNCSHCRQDFGFLLNLEARGEDHDLLFLDSAGSSDRARAMAQARLVKKSRNVVVPVPCPNCGSYQDDMARTLKEADSINAPQIAGVVITLLSFIPWAFDLEYAWALTSFIAAVGLILLTYGYVIVSRFDPNAGDPEPRKLLGQKQSVWGERLAEALAANAKTEPDNAQARGRNADS